METRVGDAVTDAVASETIETRANDRVRHMSAKSKSTAI